MIVHRFRVFALLAAFCLLGVVHATTLVSVQADNPTLVGGGMVLITARLGSPATTQVMVSVASSNTAVIPASSILIEPGKISGSIGIQTNAVTAVQQVTLAATEGAYRLTCSVTVNPKKTAANAIAAENNLTGTAAWDVTAPSRNGEIQAYAGQWSVARGGNVNLYVSTFSWSYDVDVFRLGYYGGAGARLVYTARNLRGKEQGYWISGMQLPSNSNAILHHTVTYTDRYGTHSEDTEPRDANWQPTFSFALPSQLITGLYLIRLTETDTGTQWFVPLVVRDEASGAPLIYMARTYTDEVYNGWGGASGYSNVIAGQNRSYEVSFNRPYADDFGAGNLRVWTYQFARFMEEKGFNVSYTTSNDVTEGNTNLLHYKGFITAGHDEYWSQNEYYDAITAANKGVSLAFFGGNDLYRQVRELPDLSGHSNRFVACYKGAPDPATPLKGVLGVSLNSTDWLHLGYSEANLIRTEWVGFNDTMQNFIVSNASHWVYQGTGLSNGVALPAMLGYEADGIVNSTYLSVPGHTFVVLARSPYVVYTATATETVSSEAVIDQYPAGNFMFNAATIAWPLALTNYFPSNAKIPWGPRPAVLPAVRQMTLNILNKMAAGIPTSP